MQKANIFTTTAFIVLTGMSCVVQGSQSGIMTDVLSATSAFAESVQECVGADLKALTPEVRLTVYGVIAFAGTYTVYRVAKDVGGSCKDAVSTLHDDVVSIGSTCKGAVSTFYNDILGKDNKKNK